MADFTNSAATELETDDSGATSVFQAPFTKDQLHRDVVEALISVAELTRWAFYRTDAETDGHLLHLLGLGGRHDLPSLGDPQVNWQSCGLTYDRIATTALAEDLERAYDFAYLGRIDENVSGHFNSESMASWTSRVVFDLFESALATEWDHYLPTARMGSIQRCLQALETAEARLVLEDLNRDDTFMGWHSWAQHGGLSIRQMSLLSGMTEPSLRTMANARRKNPLKTQSDGKNTYVAIADAKEWLVAKGRYVQVEYVIRDGNIDLTKRRFASTDDLLFALDQRLHYLLSGDHSESTKRLLLTISASLIGPHGELKLDRAMTKDQGFMERIGDALQMPGQLVALRASEAAALDELKRVERQIQALVG